MKLYLTRGPLEEDQLAARAALERAGYDVVAEPAISAEHPLLQKRQNLIAMLECDGVALMPHWQDSARARLTATTADAVRIPRMPWRVWRTVGLKRRREGGAGQLDG